ncbi:Pre-mRNA-splicing factor SYF2 [Gnomoniopsis smithogilvyi]|uniref:Pre-mRNA-splicing factor SYF2 n=1 Tax=Gnomoniopsis smithogilvyi TaxID=1191159 RepID=A0A9W8YTD6_9PEZI|nr:Pre-mRNA-splicing factor SYF2 [Gnomoniopsis smithogilvyi]
MPPAKKRKTTAKAKGSKKDHVVTATASSPPPADVKPEPVEDASPVPEPSDEQTAVSKDPSTTIEAPEPPSAPEKEPAAAAAPSSASQDPPAEQTEASAPPAPTTTINDRLAKFRALQSRAKTSSTANLTAAQTEAHRLANDPSQLATIQRKSAVANQKLLKADIEDSGGDFERKRAWDWTVDESEKWDERIAERAAHRDNNAFQDYRVEANKVYERQVRNLGEPDLERYIAQKKKAIEEAAARGTLEIVETEDGEMVAVDRDGTFYGGGGGRDLISSFADNKPDKKALDRLVGEMKKAEEVAAKKRRERLARNGDDGDVTYINDKNKQFNQKLSRFYNKYTAEIRDSFERGTMI